MELEEEVCRAWRIREGMKRKGNEWWSEEIRRAVERKNECFLLWRRTRLEEYVRIKKMVRIVPKARKRVNEEWTLKRIRQNYGSE